jgi:hypothetical protein
MRWPLPSSMVLYSIHTEIDQPKMTSCVFGLGKQLMHGSTNIMQAVSFLWYEQSTTGLILLYVDVIGKTQGYTSDR